MSKREETYSREYRGSRFSNPNDTILKDLSNLCLTLGNPDGSPLKRYLLFSVNPDNSVSQITVSTSEKNPPKYQKEVLIEIMPSTASLPKELSDLLKEKGFKKLK